MNEKVKKLVPKKYKNKVQIIGDLMADIKVKSEISIKDKEKNILHYYLVLKKPSSLLEFHSSWKSQII